MIHNMIYYKQKIFIDTVCDYAAEICKQFRFEIIPPVSVVADIIKHSEEIDVDVCLNDI